MKNRSIVITRYPKYEVQEQEISSSIEGEEMLLKIEGVPFEMRNFPWSDFDGSVKVSLEHFIPGTQAVGRVERVTQKASDVYGVAEGDRVFVEASIICGFCTPCLTGDYSVCAKQLRYGHFPLDAAPGPLGSISEHMRILPNSRIHKIPDGMPLERAALLGYAERAFRAIQKRAEAGLGTRMLISGLNLFSLICGLVARDVGVSADIFADDARGENADFVHNFGIRVVDEPEKNAYDVIIETAGRTLKEETLARMWDVLAPKGRFIFTDYAPDVRIPFEKFLSRELTLAGLSEPSWDFKSAFRFVESHASDLSMIESNVLDAADFGVLLSKVEKHPMASVIAVWK